MEQRLKERLTGAAILVALIVLIVPELFRGHLAERVGKAANSSEGPPMRSYLIDLGATHSTPMQLGGASAPGLASSRAVNPPTAPAESAAPVTAAPRSAPLAATAPSTSAPSAPVATARPAPSAGPAAHHAIAPAHTSSSLGTAGKAAADWSVQLGLYTKRANAEHMVRVAHTKGFSVSLAKPDTKGRYRVRVAGLTTRSAALRLAARLRAAGLPAAAVGPR